jgi:TetR/AcrR family transcriptional repressor of nem operon
MEPAVPRAARDPQRAERLLDAAEARIRQAGYGGFSFRDLGADVGVSSASVHHHFPTKTALAAAVARRYTQRFLAALADAPTPVLPAWRAGFRSALLRDGRMCLCGVLGAEAGGLPPEIVAEVRAFFAGAIAAIAAGLRAEGAAPADAETRAVAAMATLEGAMLVARAMDDPTLFDRATAALG